MPAGADAHGGHRCLAWGLAHAGIGTRGRRAEAEAQGHYADVGKAKCAGQASGLASALAPTGIGTGAMLAGAFSA